MRVLRGLAAAALWACAAVAAAEPQVALTEGGRYRVRIEPMASPVPLNAFHDWEITVATPEGAPLDPRQLAVYGGMPGHGHGLPSTPRVSERLAPGRYRVSGMRFNMAGEWELFVGVNGPAGPDKVRFEVPVQSHGTAQPAAPILGFDADEIARMQSLRLPSRAVSDPTNRMVGDAEAIALGRALFSDPRLSGPGEVSCATCHVPGLAFTDGQRVSIGSKPLRRNAPSLIGIAGADWFYWDGRRDSLWAQALTPIETSGEMDSTRVAVVRLLLEDAAYGERYARIANRPLPDLAQLPRHGGPFGDEAARKAWQRMPAVQRRQVNAAFSDVGKALAAFVATLEHAPTRFDLFAEAVARGDTERAARLLDDGERAGLKLFLDEPKTKCLRCHNGAAFTSHGFHNVGTALDADGQFDFGRAIGIRAAQHDPFNCMGDYSDADEGACSHHRFADAGHPPVGAFKVPSLRELSHTAPYMHDGRFPTLETVIAHYRATAPAADGSDDMFRLDISDAEAAQLVRFLSTLSQPRASMAP